MNMLRICLMMLMMLAVSADAQRIYETTNTVVRFHSDAPQELIRASSTALRGAIDIDKKSFAFRLPINSFMGFNSPLQREHFNENYMESGQYPEASFAGKIIEDVDLSKDGEYIVRAKGKFKIHGVEQERIIRSTVSVKKNVMTVRADFLVLLADHNIKIPRIVYDKLAPEINVSVNAVFVPRDN